MRNTVALGFALVFTLWHGASAAAQEAAARSLQLAFHADGTVSLSASNVSVREILSEWARQCGCYVVNWDKMTGGPLAVPVQYEKESQKRVLESLLRQAAGFVLTPKRAGATTVSNYETIYILATSSPVGGPYVPPPPPVASMPLPTAGAPEDEIPAVVGPPVPAAMQNGPPRPGMPTAMPGSVSGTRPGTAGVFVPIVPAGGSMPQTPTTGVPGSPMPMPPQAPGSSSAPMPVPIIAVPPPQGR